MSFIWQEPLGPTSWPDTLGENLFTTDGDAWLAHRQHCASVFGVQQINAPASTMAATITEVPNDWRPGGINMQAAMTDLTIQVALRSLLGTSEDVQDLAGEIRQAFEEILD